MKFIPLIALFLLVSSWARAETLQFGVIADGGLWNSRMAQIRDSLHQLGVRELVLPGDNIYDSKENRLSYAEAWSPFLDQGYLLNVVAIGNRTHGYAEEMSFFKMPGEYYSKTYQGVVRFIVLNSDDDSLGSQQARWLDAQLAAATEPFVFLVYHHPPYSLSTKHPWTQRQNFHEAVRPVIWKYRSKITALLLGHDHIAALVYFNDLPAVVAGATHDGHWVEVVDGVQAGVNVKLAWGYQGTDDPYWADLVLDSDTGSAQVRFVDAATGQVSFSTELKTRRPMGTRDLKSVRKRARLSR